MNRRDILKGIGAIIGIGVAGKAIEVDAAPTEASPVVQAPQYISPYEGLGSITLRSANGSWTYGTISYFYDGRHIAPVLGGFDDDGGEG